MCGHEKPGENPDKRKNQMENTTTIIEKIEAGDLMIYVAEISIGFSVVAQDFDSDAAKKWAYDQVEEIKNN